MARKVVELDRTEAMRLLATIGHGRVVRDTVIAIEPEIVTGIRIVADDRASKGLWSPRGLPRNGLSRNAAAGHRQGALAPTLRRRVNTS